MCTKFVKQMSDDCLLRFIKNIWIEKAPNSIKKLYEEVEKEFRSRNIKLVSPISAKPTEMEHIK